MLYTADLETRLLRQTGAAFLNRTTKWQWDLRQEGSFKIPALLFADDDIVLMASTRKEMRELPHAAGEFEEEYDIIAFNPTKSAVMVFTATKDTDRTGLTIQG